MAVRTKTKNGKPFIIDNSASVDLVSTDGVFVLDDFRIVRDATDRLARHFLVPAAMRDELQAILTRALRQFKSRVVQPSLPTKPVREYRARENIIDYLRDDDGFGPWYKVGELTRPLIREISPRAYMALANYLRRNELPSDMKIPTLKEVNDALLERGDFSADEASKVSSAHQRRRPTLTANKSRQAKALRSG